MIVVEDRLSEIFEFLPPINGFNPVFRYGDDKELNTFLSSYDGKSSTPYPLIWLVYPYTEKQSRRHVEITNMKFILAVRNNEVMLYDERIIKTFKGLLIPLYNNIIESFKKANTMLTDDEYNVVKYPNYGSGEEAKANDIWDAITITTDVEFNDFRLLNIKY